jgi:hypothetical protein
MPSTITAETQLIPTAVPATPPNKTAANTDRQRGQTTTSRIHKNGAARWYSIACPTTSPTMAMTACALRLAFLRMASLSRTDSPNCADDIPSGEILPAIGIPPYNTFFIPNHSRRGRHNMVI